MGGAALPPGLGWWLEGSVGTVPGTPEVLVTALSGYWCVCALAETQSCRLTASTALHQPGSSVEHPWGGCSVFPQDSGFFSECGETGDANKLKYESQPAGPLATPP